jgi:hypothetical protein
MRRLLLLACILFAAPLVAQETPMSVVADSVAHTVLGQLATVEGTVVEVKTRARHGFSYLNLGGRFPEHRLGVLIPDSVRSRFGDLEQLLGRRIRVTGQVWMQDGKWPAITLDRPIALTVLP